MKLTLREKVKIALIAVPISLVLASLTLHICSL